MSVALPWAKFRKRKAAVKLHTLRHKRRPYQESPGLAAFAEHSVEQDTDCVRGK
jgi:hypothetical protein